jgi:membrane protein CcdC involved in cytochrome C biogenesis
MNPTPPSVSGGWTLLLPMLIIGLVVLRNARARTVRMERLWIGPAMIAVMAGLSLAAQRPQTSAAIAIDIAALLVGCALGWWRGRASRFTVDPATHVVTSRMSPAGMLLILGIFALRYVVRMFASDEASVLHVNAGDLLGALLVLAVGMVAAQRIEWFIRARRMIAEAKAATALAATAPTGG